MKISYERVEQIYKTLPIGYYIGREVKSKISQDTNMSYYDILNDEIVFSYKQIKMTTDNLPEGSSDDEIEGCVRANLYHELSHALLTPRDLKPTKHMNIFEDERIERNLEDYYMNTDFKKNVRLLNNDTPTNSFDDFLFDVIRLQKGPEELQREVDNVYDRYKDLTSNSEGYVIDNYNYRVKELIRKIRDYYDNHRDEIQNQKDQESQNQNGNQKDQNQSNQNNGQSQSQSQNQNQSQSNNDQKSNQNGQSSSSNNEEGEDSEDSQSPMNNDGEDTESQSQMTESEEDGDEESAAEKIQKEMKRASKFKAIKELFSEIVDDYQNDRLQQELDLIFNRAVKAHKMQSSAVSSYSGRFDPRQVLRDDYKYFIQQNRNGNLKGYTKTHLNLFLDRSGSYQDNCHKTNELLVSLRNIERKNPQFSFTIISCGSGETIENKERYVHRAYDGTTISKNIYEIFNKVQDKSSVNYNIVLYDGYAYNGNRFDAFNSANTAIITDYTNKRNVETNAPSATKIFVDDNEESYADVLQKNVLKVLENLVR